MKTIRIGLCVLLILSLAFLPLGVGLCACFGLQFELASDSFGAWLPALLALGLMILCLIDRDPERSGMAGPLLSAAAPLALLHALILWQKTDGSRGIALVMILCALCSFVISAVRGKPKAWKTFCLALAGILFVPYCYFTFFSLWAGGYDEAKVTHSLSSPGGQYEARMIEDVQSVNYHHYVEVHENRKLDAGIFTIEKAPIRIQPDYWNGTEIQIAWKDDSHLIVNGREYPIA